MSTNPMLGHSTSTSAFESSAARRPLLGGLGRSGLDLDENPSNPWSINRSMSGPSWSTEQTEQQDIWSMPLSARTMGSNAPSFFAGDDLDQPDSVSVLFLHTSFLCQILVRHGELVRTHTNTGTT